MKEIFSLIIIALLSCQSTTGQSYDSIIDIDVQEFKSLLEHNPEFALIDVRTPKEADAGKIEDALVIDFLNKEFKQNIMQVDTSKTILLYCRSGKRSAKAAKIMMDLGFKKIYNLDGGFLDWSKKIDDK